MRKKGGTGKKERVEKPETEKKREGGGVNKKKKRMKKLGTRKGQVGGGGAYGKKEMSNNPKSRIGEGGNLQRRKG